MKSVATATDRFPAEADDARSYAVRQYRMPAKVMHWVTAVLIVGMVASGVIAKQLGGGAVADTLFGVHKLTGVFIVVLILARLAYRLLCAMPEWGLQTHRRPVLHWTLYGAVLLVPLLGWAGISDFGAREVFGITLPQIWPEGAGYDELLLQLHAYSAFGLMALVGLHIGVALQDYMTDQRADPRHPN
jgi:cytochrome b561